MRKKQNQHKTTSASRRGFLKTSAAVGLAATAVSINARGANERIGVGFIGAGGRATAHMKTLQHLRDEMNYPIEFVAVCDIYRPSMELKKKKFGIAKGYMDHRELLADDEVDVVFIATPDHHHGYQAIDAIQAGKDVYCEKPVTHWRQFKLTKKLADVAAASDQVFIVGTQGMSDTAWHQMKKLVQEGLIGKPLYGETGYFRLGDWGERGMKIHDPHAKPGKDLNWKAFLGDAPKKPFSVDRLFRWRLFEDYAGGPVTDLYPHCLTQVIDILGVGFPELVVATGGIHRYGYELREVPDTFNLLAQYPEKATISVLGTQANDFNLTDQRGAGKRQPAIRGWDGTLHIEGNKEIVFRPVSKDSGKTAQRFPIERPESMTEYFAHFLDCCKARDKNTWSPMDLAFRTQTVLQMAMLAMREGKTARFDAKKRDIIL